MKRKIDPKQIIIDRRSSFVDLNLRARFLRKYAKAKLNVSAYEKAWKVVEDIVHSYEKDLSEEDKLAHKILIDDSWIWYKDLRNPNSLCPGEKVAVEHIRKHNRLHPECEKCRKVLVFNFDEGFLRRITEEFLTRHLNFNFKIARDLGVFVAYCRGDKSKDKMIDYLNGLLKSYRLKGRIQWRIGGRYLQLAAPHLFKSAKILSYQI